MFHDVRVKLRPKIAESRRHRVKSKLSVTTEGTCLHIDADFLHQGQIIGCAFQATEPLQDFKQVTHAHPAGETLAARFVLAEGDQ